MPYIWYITYIECNIPIARKFTWKRNIHSLYVDMDFVYPVCIYLDAAVIPK